MSPRLTEADLDARELERISVPAELDAIAPGCSGACLQGRGTCDCKAERMREWRQFFWLELDNPWLLALYAALLVGAIALSAVLPGPWWGR